MHLLYADGWNNPSLNVIKSISDQICTVIDSIG